MEILIAFMLFLIVAMLLTLMFMGYHFYYKSKNKDTMTESMLMEKQNELLDLYEMLETMMKEMEQENREVREEILKHKEQIKSWHDELFLRASLEVTKTQSKIRRLPEPAVPLSEIPDPQKDGDKLKDVKEIKIRSLYRKGKTIPQIARELGIGQGEVELILNLEKSFNLC